MRDCTYVGYLMLPDCEIKVLESLFSLVPELAAGYKLVGPKELLTADVVIVNADNPAAIRQWSQLSSNNNLITPIMLGATEKADSDIASLQRPVNMKKLLSVLQEVTAAWAVNSDAGCAGRNGLKVLVVDDSYPVRKYMEHKLQELASSCINSINLSFAASGEEAQDLVAQEEYDMIFLDVVMTGIDGYTVCKALKAKYSVYVVMLTSKKSPFDRVRGAMSGCDGYITKPPSNERLSAELKKCAAIVRQNTLGSINPQGMVAPDAI